MERRNNNSFDKLGLSGSSDFMKVLTRQKLTLYHNPNENSYLTIPQYPFNKAVVSVLIIQNKFPDVPLVNKLATEVWNSVKDFKGFRYAAFSWSNIAGVRSFIDCQKMLVKIRQPKNRIYDQALARLILWNLLIHPYKSVTLGSPVFDGLIIPALEKPDKIIYKNPNDAGSYDEILEKIESKF